MTFMIFDVEFCAHNLCVVMGMLNFMEIEVFMCSSLWLMFMISYFDDICLYVVGGLELVLLFVKFE